MLRAATVACSKTDSLLTLQTDMAASLWSKAEARTAFDCIAGRIWHGLQRLDDRLDTA